MSYGTPNWNSEPKWKNEKAPPKPTSVPPPYDEPPAERMPVMRYMVIMSVILFVATLVNILPQPPLTTLWDDRIMEPEAPVHGIDTFLMACFGFFLLMAFWMGWVLGSFFGAARMKRALSKKS